MKQRILLSLLLLLPIVATAAAWYSEYDAALKAIAAQNWAAAEARLQTSMKLQPRQGRRVFAYGVRFIRYIPQYYIGMVRFHQARFEDALNQFQQVQKLGLVVSGDPEYAEMVKLIQSSEQKLKPKTAESAPAVPAPVVETQKPPPVDVEAQKMEEQKKLREQFQSLMNRSKSALSAKNFRQSRELAEQAAATGVENTDELLHQIDIAEKLDSLLKIVRRQDWLQAQTTAQQLRALDANNPELIRIQPLIDQGLTEMKTQDLEDRALLAFFSGNYAQASLLLEQVIAQKKDIAEAWFYLGCSHASLGLLQGNDGKNLLSKARQEFLQARKLDPKLAYIPELISPRIVELYQQAK